MEQKSKSKYAKGEPIRSLDELMAQELICFDNKIYHRGWFLSWQLLYAKRIIDAERVFKVTKQEATTN